AGAGDNAFFARFANKIYGFKSGDMTAEVIVDLLNSDIDPAYIGRVFAAENGEFLAARLDGSEMITSLSRLTPDPDAVLGDKALLQLATLWLDPVTRGAVLDFNRTSKTARIEVLDFDRDLTRFDLALIGQSPADLYSFNGGYGLDAVKYVSKGVFADLYPLLDADETLSRGDMFQNVLDAASIGGSLYYATPFFTVNTLAGKESVFGDVSAITPEELENVADKYPDASIYEIMAAAPVQQAWVPLVLSNMSRYVNLETGEVNFDGPEFIAQLRLSERMPLGLDFASLDIMEFMNDYPARRANGEVLLEAVAISGPRAARTLETELFGEPVALVGVPTYGENGGRISPHTVYTVSSVTEHPEEAWSFIASMLSEDFEPRFENSYYVAGRVVRDEKLTLNKNIFERRVAEEMTPLAERDISNGMLVSEFSMARLASWPVFSLDELDMTLPKYQSYALTETDAARVREAIEGATVLTAHDTALMNIALEELGAFYAGVKTAEETARLIQSRAALYVAEQG
ncbi:MAG: hypothetical protein LBK23_11680, partial [Oscillospiraceae bacterium]|nr:hypothetical protein [Oscillospiraceae bacterium]